MSTITNNRLLMRNYYCSAKFKYLKINLSSFNTYNCHAATPHRIDFNWLKNNQGNLFNTDINVQERTMMLKNERNASCEPNCWAAEDHGAVSPRMYQKATAITCTDTITTPEKVDLTINNDCNLTCSYCCSEYSSAWQRDISNTGDYEISGVADLRYRETMQGRILSKVSQCELHNSSRYKLLIDEIRCYGPTLKQLDITGGEPLLDNQLVETLTSLNLNPDCQVILYTGLGVSTSRFQRMISGLSSIKNLQVRVSAENIGSFLEFNRYGIKWNEFQEKISILDQYVDWKFHCTISNLTIFGFAEFANFFNNRDIDLTFAYQPSFMSPFVIDPQSKQQILIQIQNLNPNFQQSIIDSISAVPSDKDRQSIRDFLKIFVSRRPDISLDIFPKSFLQWMDSTHVV